MEFVCFSLSLWKSVETRRGKFSKKNLNVLNGYFIFSKHFHRITFWKFFLKSVHFVLDFLPFLAFHFGNMSKKNSKISEKTDYFLDYIFRFSNFFKNLLKAFFCLFCEYLEVLWGEFSKKNIWKKKLKSEGF